MKPATGLRTRLTIGIVAYTILLSLAVAAHGFFFNERAEYLLWESRLQSDLEEAAARQRAGIPWNDSETTKLYGALSGTTVPAALAALSPGIHDEIAIGGKQFVIIVQGDGANKSALALDITAIERDELKLTWTMVASTMAVVTLLAFLTYLAAGRVLRPLTNIAHDVSLLPPGQDGQRIELQASAPREAVQIAEAINDHLRRFEQFVERERAFINTASHELRTPIAVIAGSAEVALDREPQSIARSQLQHILTTARDMQELVALLLTLAKDPRGLVAKAEKLDLAQLIPTIVADHRHLAEPKELTLEVAPLPPTAIIAPRQVVLAAIGNLVRNAIENSNRGCIQVSIATPCAVVIQDPGHGMSALEISQIYTRLARTGDAPASGIGLELITRLCEHLGWQLKIESQAGQGTTAILAFPEFAQAPQSQPGD
jgi:signal transduction histidine kinase